MAKLILRNSGWMMNILIDLGRNFRWLPAGAELGEPVDREFFRRRARFGGFDIVRVAPEPADNAGATDVVWLFTAAHAVPAGCFRFVGVNFYQVRAERARRAEAKRQLKAARAERAALRRECVPISGAGGQRPSSARL